MEGVNKTENKNNGFCTGVFPSSSMTVLDHCVSGLSLKSPTRLSLFASSFSPIPAVVFTFLWERFTVMFSTTFVSKRL